MYTQVTAENKDGGSMPLRQESDGLLTSSALGPVPPIGLEGTELTASYGIADIDSLADDNNSDLLKPSCWTWVYCTRVFWRNIGLAILTYLNSWTKEPKKVPISSSRRVAIARCAVHILPACVSCILVGINISGFFIGGQLQGVTGKRDHVKQNVLQITAKLQEMLIVASMASIIMHYLRREIVRGDGVPLGLLISGWSFASAR